MTIPTPGAGSKRSATRPAVESGLEVLTEHRSSSPPKGKAWDVMFGKEQFKRR